MDRLMAQLKKSTDGDLKNSALHQQMEDLKALKADGPAHADHNAAVTRRFDFFVPGNRQMGKDDPNAKVEANQVRQIDVNQKQLDVLKQIANIPSINVSAYAM
jgi:hypothetical protein